jgi:hypothetical protein
MNTTKLALFLSTLFVVVGTISCSSEQDQLTDVSSQLEIDYQMGPEIPLNGEVQTWINNTTNNCISFPPDFGIKVFVKQDEDWLEVPNLVTYANKEPQVLKPKSDLFPTILVSIWPDVSSLNIKMSLDGYALITGHLCEDESHVIEKKIPFVIVP